VVYFAQGLKRDRVLKLLGISKNQYYYRPKVGKRGGKKTSATRQASPDGKVECKNNEVVDQIKAIQNNPDTDYGYRKMTYQQQIPGVMINHKKVYRLMKTALLLKEKHKGLDKQYAQYRTLNTVALLEVNRLSIL